MITPRETVRTAFFDVLTAAFTQNGDPEVVKYRPFIGGVPQNSISFQLVAGTNQSPGLGRRVSSTQSGMWERYRIQIDIFNPYSYEAAGQIADRVEQAIILALNTFRSSYGVVDIRKIVDMDSGPTDPAENLAHSILDYSCMIEATNTDPSP
jgi:hypothetical protein